MLAIAAPTPIGANFITNSVKRNITSASDSHHTTIDLAFSPMLVTANANKIEKTTICSTSPSAIALMIELGARCVISSPNDCGLAAGSAPATSIRAAPVSRLRDNRVRLAL